jgi:hypothetical protein
MYNVMFPLHLLSSNHKSTHPCCKPAQKMVKSCSTSKRSYSSRCFLLSTVCRASIERVEFTDCRVH